MTVGERIRKALSGLRPDHLPALGAITGLALAALGAFSAQPQPPMPDAAALVNGVPIARADHHRIVEALAAGKRNPLDTEDVAYALTRLIEEELLIQRSIEVGLHRTDAMARKRLVAAMLEWIAADATDREPPDDDLRKFYEKNAALFTQAARADVGWFHIARSDPGGEARAQEIARKLKDGELFAKLAADASPSALTLPAGLLPPAKLHDYLGPSLTREALALTPGEPAGPFARADGWHFLVLRGREKAAPPAFETIRGQVEAEYLRQRGDEAVRRYLDWLRRRADIVMVRSGNE
jgi:hypothetical protein